MKLYCTNGVCFVTIICTKDEMMLIFAEKRFHFPGNTRNADGDGEHGGHSFVLGNKTTKATQGIL